MVFEKKGQFLLVLGKKWLFRRRWASSHDVPPEYMAKLKYPPTAQVENASVALKFNGPLRNFDSSKLICHELDTNGRMHMHGRAFAKSKVCASLGLQPRDLRKLDGTFGEQLPVILVRESAVLVYMDPIRAIIKHDGIILFENYGGGRDLSQRQHQFMKHLQERLKSFDESSGPFEFFALEVILQRVLSRLRNDYEALSAEVEEHLRVLESIVHWERLKVLLACKKRVASFQERVNSLRSCINEVLESDADMADMYLSEKAASPRERPEYAHEEIELMLESYLKQAEEIGSQLQLLATNMQSTEDIVNIGLVGQRNELLLLELKMSIGTFAASIGGFGAGILGMNLPNSFESSNTAFWMVCAGLSCFATGSFVILWRLMLRLVHRRS